MSIRYLCFSRDKIVLYILLPWFILLFINHYNYLTNTNIIILFTKWKITKKLEDSIKLGHAKNILIDIEMNNLTCSLNGKLLLHWRLFCQH